MNTMTSSTEKEDILQKEFQYFIDNQEKLVKKYNNKYIVIRDHNVVGSYDDIGAAYAQAKEKFQLGTFLIQHCTAGRQAYTQTFNSRLIFA
jgi:Family of unknown function (DUF5678)